jgi:hypothetical protein
MRFDFQCGQWFLCTFPPYFKCVLIVHTTELNLERVFSLRQRVAYNIITLQLLNKQMRSQYTFKHKRQLAVPEHDWVFSSYTYFQLFLFLL